MVSRNERHFPRRLSCKATKIFPGFSVRQHLLFADNAGAPCGTAERRRPVKSRRQRERVPLESEGVLRIPDGVRRRGAPGSVPWDFGRPLFICSGPPVPLVPHSVDPHRKTRPPVSRRARSSLSKRPFDRLGKFSEPVGSFENSGSKTKGTLPGFLSSRSSFPSRQSSAFFPSLLTRKSWSPSPRRRLPPPFPAG